MYTIKSKRRLGIKQVTRGGVISKPLFFKIVNVDKQTAWSLVNMYRQEKRRLDIDT
jgi:hypothetical protein